MSQELNGSVALVTGGSSGIGRAAALAFAAEGAKVVVVGRREANSLETVHLIEEAGGEAFFLRADVTRSREVQEMIDRTVKHYGKLDYAFNNAGIEGDPYVRVADLSETTWENVISTNLTGIFLCMKYELPHILASKGAIVNTASVAGLVGVRLGSAYCASKHGVVGLTKAAALQYASQGIRINAVAPGIIETDMADRAGFLAAGSPAHARAVGLHPLGRLGTPEEVAQAVIWLCSKRAGFITGHTLPVDGGYLVP
jgi:NAD(P)-dependent dehydrogenase (short-subunit alcohol dehydrogenase family)